MSSKKTYSDSELISMYYNGKLSPNEMHALEKRALSDPFLADALDGFEEYPGLREHFEKKRENRGYSSLKTVLIAGGVLGAIAGFVVLLNKNYTDRKVEMADNADSTLNMVEVEVLPVSIDTLVMAEEADLVTASEISQNSLRYQPVNDPNKSNDSKVDSIIVEERDLDVGNEEFQMEDEHGGNPNNNGAPTAFMYAMLVVDYRFVQREKSNIRYTKYELSGISAEYENAEVRSNTDLVEKQVDVSYVEYLLKSMEFFADGDYKKALSRYSVILEQYPDDINAIFYGGLSYYNLKQFDKALEFFEKIENHELLAFREEAYWYRAKTMVKIGDLSEARKILDEIILGGGFYTEDAILFRKSLK